MPKTYEPCPRCKRKGLFLTGQRSWVTTHHGEQVYTCRYCSYTETRSAHAERQRTDKPCEACGATEEPQIRREGRVFCGDYIACGGRLNRRYQEAQARYPNSLRNPPSWMT